SWKFMQAKLPLQPKCQSVLEKDRNLPEGMNNNSLKIKKCCRFEDWRFFGELLDLFAWYPFQALNSGVLALFKEYSQRKKYLQTI
ncbi:580_t:CDS:2, partial [Funneliformis geosporum]